MPIAKKSKPISPAFSPEQMAAAMEAAAPDAPPAPQVNWNGAVVTSGGGVADTISQLRRVRGKNKNPTKEQVALRLDPEVLAAFRASGRGWQTRMNTALKEWLETGALSKSQLPAKPGR